MGSGIERVGRGYLVGIRVTGVPAVGSDHEWVEFDDAAAADGWPSRIQCRHPGPALLACHALPSPPRPRFVLRWSGPLPLPHPMPEPRRALSPSTLNRLQCNRRKRGKRGRGGGGCDGQIALQQRPPSQPKEPPTTVQQSIAGIEKPFLPACFSPRKPVWRQFPREDCGWKGPRRRRRGGEGARSAQPAVCSPAQCPHCAQLSS